MAPRNSSNKFFKSAKNNYDSNGDSRLMSRAYDQSSPYSQTAYVGPVTRSRKTAEVALMNPMYRTLQNIGDAEVTRPDGSRVLSVRRTAGKNKENLAQRFRDLLVEGYLKPKRSYEAKVRLDMMAAPKTAAEYQRLSDAVTFMGNLMGDEQRGYLEGKASRPIKPGPTRGSSAMKRLSKADEYKPGEYWSPGRSGKTKVKLFMDDETRRMIIPSWEQLDPVENDEYSARDQWRQKQYNGAHMWANDLGIFDRRNSSKGGGIGFELDQGKDGNKEFINIREFAYPEYNNNKLPQGLVQGRTFYGLPGGRSGRGVGTAKRLSKTSIYDPPKPSKKRKPPIDDRFPPIPMPYPFPSERKFPRMTPRRSPEGSQYRPSYTRSGPTRDSQQYK